ncbi:MAG: DNA repair exonuclease [Euryarchaeota archaeon]|nr:DNA repair exonuclease [Euryarchaeota archaeon]
MLLSPNRIFRPFRFVHTADLHLGSRIAIPKGMDQGASTKLVNSTYDVWRDIIDLCICESVDFILIAGDVYDSADRNIRAQLQFRDGLRRLDESGIAAYVVRGNHDPDVAWSDSIPMPKNTAIFSSKHPHYVIHHDSDGTPIATIVGMSFETAHIRDNLAERFPQRDPEWPYTIGLLHCSVGGSQGHEPYAPCSVQDLKQCHYDYWALGHIHCPDVLNPEHPHIAYAGNPQGRNIGETDKRGCRFISVDEYGNTDVRVISTSRYVWKEISINVGDSEDLGGLEEDLRRELSALIEKEGTPVIGRITLTGSTPLHRELMVEEGVVALRDRFIEDPLTEPYPFYLDQIICQTLPVIDREAVLSRDDILGEICKQCDLATIDETIRERLKGDISILYRGMAYRPYIDELCDDELDIIIREAESLLLSQLSREDLE